MFVMVLLSSSNLNCGVFIQVCPVEQLKDTCSLPRGSSPPDDCFISLTLRVDDGCDAAYPVSSSSRSSCSGINHRTGGIWTHGFWDSTRSVICLQSCYNDFVSHALVCGCRVAAYVDYTSCWLMTPSFLSSPTLYCSLSHFAGPHHRYIKLGVHH